MSNKTLLVRFADALSEVAESFTISVIVFLFIYFVIAFPEVVVGASMEPNLREGERLLVERVTGRFNRLARGDIVIFNPPTNDNIDYVKRIIGMPRDELFIRDCKIFRLVDNTEIQIDEPYLTKGTCTQSISTNPFIVPDGHFFVLGDNRNHSADSRVFGFVEKKRVGGKVFMRFWPMPKISFI